MPAYQVKQGHGSFLTMEFGSPSLVVHEPKEPKPEMSERVNQSRARRLVTVRGEWHLWIYCCQWEILQEEKVLSHDESPDSTIQKAADFLNGQKLIRVAVRPDSSTIFQFDLGGILRTQPYEDGEVDEQWMLYEPSKRVFRISSDGSYAHSPGNTPPDKVDSNPLFPPEDLHD
jgi:hypothetical protein